jgi:large subunit ribosomal protein L37Ae
MPKGDKKAGSAGRYGARYGVVVRNLTRDIEKVEKAKYECPTCHHKSVRRMGSGIWYCRRCDAKFAAAAYSPIQRKMVTKQEEEAVVPEVMEAKQ